MRRKLIRSTAFVRAAKRVIKRNPQTADDLGLALEHLTQDAFHPSLRTHKLKGDLKNSWACTVAHDLRIVFSFAQLDGEEVVLLETLGSHDAVY